MTPAEALMFLHAEISVLESRNEPLAVEAARTTAARLRVLADALALHNTQQPDTLATMRTGLEHTPTSRLRMSAKKKPGDSGDLLDRIRYAQPRGYTLRELEEALKKGFEDVAVSNAQLSRILSGKNRCKPELAEAIKAITGVDILA